jgi:hypothetical protein
MMYLYKRTSPLRAMSKRHYCLLLADYFAAGTGAGLGCLPFDSLRLSLLPMMISLGFDQLRFNAKDTTSTRNLRLDQISELSE